MTSSVIAVTSSISANPRSRARAVRAARAAGRVCAPEVDVSMRAWPCQSCYRRGLVAAHPPPGVGGYGQPLVLLARSEPSLIARLHVGAPDRSRLRLARRVSSCQPSGCTDTSPMPLEWRLGCAPRPTGAAASPPRARRSACEAQRAGVPASTHRGGKTGRPPKYRAERGVGRHATVNCRQRARQCPCHQSLRLDARELPDCRRAVQTWRLGDVVEMRREQPESAKPDHERGQQTQVALIKYAASGIVNATGMSMKRPSHRS